MTCKVFLELENYEYASIRLFFKVLYRSFVSLFWKNICKLCGSHIFMGTQVSGAYGTFQTYLLSNNFKNPPRSLPRQ